MIGTDPHILPLIHIAGPYDIVGDGCLIARVVNEMLQTVVHRHAIKSIICTDIEIAILVFVQTLHGVSIQRRNLGEVLQSLVGAVQGSLGTYPVTVALGIVSQGIHQRLCSGSQENLALVETETGERTHQKSLLCMQDSIHIVAKGIFPALHIKHSQLPYRLFPALVSIRFHRRCRSIDSLLRIKLQHSTSRSQIEHAALEAERIDADMTKRMGSKMAIVVIAIITVETVVGTQPDYS